MKISVDIEPRYNKGNIAGEVANIVVEILLRM